MRAGNADPHVARWVRSVPAGSLFLSVIVLHGLEVAVQPAERRDPVQGALLRSRLADPVAPSFVDRILPIDGVAA